jgi:hypothetical protein
MSESHVGARHASAEVILKTVRESFIGIVHACAAFAFRASFLRTGQTARATEIEQGHLRRRPRDTEPFSIQQELDQGCSSRPKMRPGADIRKTARYRGLMIVISQLSCRPLRRAHPRDRTDT